MLTLSHKSLLPFSPERRKLPELRYSGLATWGLRGDHSLLCLCFRWGRPSWATPSGQGSAHQFWARREKEESQSYYEFSGDVGILVSEKVMYSAESGSVPGAGDHLSLMALAGGAEACIVEYCPKIEKLSSDRYFEAVDRIKKCFDDYKSALEECHEKYCK